MTDARSSKATADEHHGVRDALATTVSPETPLEGQPPRTTGIVEVAAGVPAVTSTLRHALGAMGPVRTARTLLRVNQTHGFDCPSCAWPDTDVNAHESRELVAFCENGAKAVADEATTARCTPEFFAAHDVAWLRAQPDHWLNAQGRLTHPMLLAPGDTHYRPITWDDAFARIAAEVNALASPDEAVFYTSGRTSNETAFLYQLFARQLGTNNLPDCSNMCHESSGVALSETIGIGKGTVTLDDFERTDLVIILGQNPGTNHPRMLTALQKAKRRGAKIISVNPLPETGLRAFKHPQEVFATLFGGGTPLTDLFLPARIHADLAVVRGVVKELLGREERAPGEGVARAFVDARTEGFEAYRGEVEATSWSDILEETGLPREAFAAAAEMIARAKGFIVCWAMGLTQAPAAVATIQEVVNLVLLRGSIGKPGAGLCPVRGHSNVQGDRTVGIWEKPTPQFLEALGKAFDFTPPSKHGFDVVETIHAMRDGRAKVFFAMGGNFLSATPDTHVTAEALAKTRLTAHVSTKLNRSHLVPGRTALILPCLGRTEADVQGGGKQFVTCENSMGVVQRSEGRLAPASPELLSEPMIVARLARAVLGAEGAAGTNVDWEALVHDYDAIRERIEQVVPGFEKYNERVRSPGGFYLPNGPREGRFTTRSGRAKFSAHPLPRRPLKPGELVMMTMRSHDQFNTTVYGLDDRYRGVHGGRRVIFMHPEDLRTRGLDAGDAVDITSHFRGETRTVRHFTTIAFPIPLGNAATYFPEANPLVPLGSVAARSNTPSSKYVVVTVTRAEPRPALASASAGR